MAPLSKWKVAFISHKGLVGWERKRNDRVLTGVEVEEDVDEILVPPGDPQLVLPEVGQDVLHPSLLSHPRQVHQHHARVNTFT